MQVSPAACTKEFLEESGVVVEPREALEPWFYVFGDRAVLIVPMACDVVSVPDKLFDQDGGHLEWVGDKRLGDIRLPGSYLASIRRERPGLMRYAGNPGPPYPDDLFRIELVVRHPGGEECHAVDEACDLAELLGSLGWPDAQFHTVDYGGGSGLRVVFWADA